MGVRHKETCIKTENKRLSQEAARVSALELMFTNQAEQGVFADEVIAIHAPLLVEWTPNGRHQKGCIRRCPETGGAYKCIEPINPKARNLPDPPSMAKEHWVPLETE